MREPVTHLPDILDPVAIYHLAMRLVQRRNILITGSAGSGKTTVQRALGSMLGPNLHIGVAEDRPEIALISRNNLITARSRLESGNQLQISDLIHGFLKMRVNWILTGEIRNGEDAEAYLAVATMGTGIIGDVHGADAPTAIERLCYMGTLYEQFDLAYTRVQQGIHTIVHVQQARGQAWDSRRLISIHDVIPNRQKPERQPQNRWYPTETDLNTIYIDPRLRSR